jgi:hypothetical protein
MTVVIFFASCSEAVTIIPPTVVVNLSEGPSSALLGAQGFWSALVSLLARNKEILQRMEGLRGGGAKRGGASGSKGGGAGLASYYRFFDSPAVPDEIKRRVASFLPARDAVGLSKTCKSVRSTIALGRDAE